MADLTFNEVMTKYDTECREVLSRDQYEAILELPRYRDTAFMRELSRMTIIGACAQWLSGMRQVDEYRVATTAMQKVSGHSPEPLRFYLNEVHENMKGGG